MTDDGASWALARRGGAVCTASGGNSLQDICGRSKLGRMEKVKEKPGKLFYEHIFYLQGFATRVGVLDPLCSVHY